MFPKKARHKRFEVGREFNFFFFFKFFFKNYLCVCVVCTCGYVCTTIHLCSFGHNFPEAVLFSTMGLEIKLSLPVLCGKSLVPTKLSLLLCILSFSQCLTHIAQATCYLTYHIHIAQATLQLTCACLSTHGRLDSF